MAKSNIYGLIEDGKVTFATDWSGCYDVKDGRCYCAECFYYGAESVNCAYADYHIDSLVPIVWDKDKKEFVIEED